MFLLYFDVLFALTLVNFSEGGIGMHLTRTLFALLLIGSASVTFAQQQEPLTYVALFRVEPANTQAFIERGKEYAPTLDKLLADGVISGYGMDVDVLHNPKALNVAFWYTASNYTNLQKAEDAIGAFQAKSPELLKATSALTDLSKHQDIIVRSIEGNWSKSGACKNPVTSFSTWVVKPGKNREFLNGFRNSQKPVLEQLVKDGTICSYQVDVEDFHSMEPGKTWMIVAMPDMSAMDKVDAAYEAANAKLSAPDRAARAQAFRDLVVPGKHEDSISRAAMYKVK